MLKVSWLSLNKYFKPSKGPESWTKVNDACQATIKAKILQNLTDEVLYDYGKIEFEVGEAELHKLPFGVNTALKKMHRGDVAHIECKGKNDLTDENKTALALKSNVIMTKYTKSKTKN